MSEYKLSYTASEIDRKLGEIDNISSSIPSSLSELSDDSTHRTVTDVEKNTWSNKSKIAIQNESPIDGELWIDTDENEEITLAEIDDTTYSSEKTWSSSKINEKFENLDLPVEVAIQSDKPTDESIWINTDANEDVLIAEIDDDTIADDKTWSSSKINNEFSNLNMDVVTPDLSEYYTKTESDNKYQSKGNYLTSIPSDVANHKDDMSMHIVYGICETAADVIDKIVTVDDNFTLKEGVTVIIKFVNANSIASPTLNVNGTGAKPMYRYGTTTLSTGTTTTGWIAGAIQMFVYDGTGWIRDYWNNTTYSNVSLGHGYTTCSTAASTTAKTASLSSYALTTGGSVSVKFTNAVPAGATLNINSKGAKAIYYRGKAITADVIKAGDTATFVYNSQYHLISIDRFTSESTTETWTFTLADGSTVTKKVVLA